MNKAVTVSQSFVNIVQGVIIYITLAVILKTRHAARLYDSEDHFDLWDMCSCFRTQ